MGRGRAPCCDKTKVKTGPWSPAEDLRLISFIQKYGYGNWRALPKQAGLSRCGKSCRLRWINYLRPDVKRGNFTIEEEEAIIKLHETLGNKWSKIAACLPGRTDNEIKNVWNTHLKKRLADNHKNETKEFSRTSSFSTSSSTSSFMSSNGNTNSEDREEGLVKRSDEPKEDIPTTDHYEPTKEASSSSNSSISCYASDYSNSSVVVDVAMPTEEEGSLFNFGEADTATIAYEVGNKNPSDDSSDDYHQVIEFPLEDCDVDFWDLLDNLDDPFQPINEEAHVGPMPCEGSANHSVNDLCVCSSSLNESQPQELEASQNSNYDQGEIEYCREWLRELENELGLVEATSDGVGQLGSDEMILRPEIDHAKCYFQTWPSPPQNFRV